MVGSGKVSWRMFGGEFRSLPLRWLDPDEHLDRAAPAVPPVVFVAALRALRASSVTLGRALGGRGSRASPILAR